MVEARERKPWWPYLVLGSLFGVILTQSQVISWYRIQEMFRFESFHMYGIIGSAVVVAALSTKILRRLDAHSYRGEPIQVVRKEMGGGRHLAIGGVIFGVGWGITGACPGPVFALVGNGVWGALVVLAGALGGTWVYAHSRHRLPH